QIDAFLKTMQTAHTSRTGHKAAHTPGQGIVQTQFATPKVLQVANPLPMDYPQMTMPTHGHPVPTHAKAPKHLFHFIIRYGGEGIIGSSVGDLFNKICGGGEGPGCKMPNSWAGALRGGALGNSLGSTFSTPSQGSTTYQGPTASPSLRGSVNADPLTEDSS